MRSQRYLIPLDGIGRGSRIYASNAHFKWFCVLMKLKVLSIWSASSYYFFFAKIRSLLKSSLILFHYTKKNFKFWSRTKVIIKCRIFLVLQSGLSNKETFVITVSLIIYLKNYFVYIFYTCR